MRFQCYRTVEDRFYWRLLSRNHRIVAIAPQGFEDPATAESAVRLVRANAAEALIDLTSDRGGSWSWLMRMGADVVAVSAHRYGRRVEAVEATKRFRNGAVEAPIDGRFLLLSQSQPACAAAGQSSPRRRA